MPSHNVYYTVAVSQCHTGAVPQCLIKKVPSHSVIIQVPSHSLYNRGAVTTCLTYRCRLTMFIMQVLSHGFYYKLPPHSVYYTGAVTKCLSMRRHHAVFYIQVTSDRVCYTGTVTNTKIRGTLTKF